MDLLAKLKNRFKDISDKERQINKDITDAFASVEQNTQGKSKSSSQDPKIKDLIQDKNIIKNLRNTSK